jgi:glycosyltransferase involved in cell wall biosynthesis/SAM-dependent methyltransferase
MHSWCKLEPLVPHKLRCVEKRPSGVCVRRRDAGSQGRDDRSLADLRQQAAHYNRAPSLNACTIIARNYLAQARVLARSYLQHHPASRFFALVIDAPAPATTEPFETLDPLEIGLEPEEFQRMAAIYDVMELATAVKPWLLRRLLNEGDEVVYLDPDIEVFASLEKVRKLAREHSIVLTPHSPEPLPHDRKLPGETTFLFSGIYNLGFVALGPRSDAFLDWWSERVARDCIVAPERGHFVDQRWVDFVPALFDHAILRDPAYNVAWWNLPTRTFRWTGNRYNVDGKPLRFFHYSGFDPREPHVLSKHQGESPRILLSEHPDLARICGEYAQKLFDGGFAEVSSLPYRYDSADGLPIDRRMRRLYRDALIAAEEEGEPEPPNPFGDKPAFLAWLQEPRDGRGGLARMGRYLEAVYRDRPDLHAAFPDVRWLDTDAFFAWVVAHGQDEERIPLELLPGPPTTSAPAPVESDLPDGVNVAGYFRAEVGVGEAARQLLSALEHAGIPFATVTYEETPSRQAHPFEPVDTHARYDINLICVNADRLPEFAYDMGPDFFAGRYSIGLWWWELGEFPRRFDAAFDVVDEVWVGSDFVAAAVARETAKPVRVLPLAVEARPKSVPRGPLGVPEGFQFLFSFDFFSVFERKNPLALIAAFKAAFASGEGPILLIKSINGDRRLVDLERLRAAADRDDIVVLDRYVSAEEKDALMNGCDCYVSLHRSEGFGLTMAEAMALAKPVIATAYSGNLMFMTEENSYLVPYRLAAVPKGCDPYPAGAEWAEPDIEAAAKMMRDVFENQERAREVGLRAQDDIRNRHSAEQSAEFVAARLEDIRNRRGETAHDSVPAPTVPRDGQSDAIGRAVAYVERGPTLPWDAPSRLGPLGKLLRRLTRRLLRPYTIRHQEFDAAVAHALVAQQRTLDELAQATAALDARASAFDAPAAIATVEQRLATTQRRQVERLVRVERAAGAINESVEAQLAAQREEIARTRLFEQEAQNHLASIDSHLASLLAGGDAEDDYGRAGTEGEADVSSFGDRFPPPDRPWTPEYTHLHRRLVGEALDDARFMELVRAARPLPPGYGVGFDERVVELPWVFAQDPHGRVLDAGSALNHAHVLDRLRPDVATLDIVTLAPEDVAFPKKNISYVYADLRELPYRDDHFTMVISLSTLDHVGMDNAMYGVDAPRAEDPDRETIRAVAELLRVTAPGGTLLVTVPYGRHEDRGWMRQFGRDDVERLIHGVPARETSCCVYRYSRDGWQLSDLDEAADCEYRDYLHDPRPVDDLAAAARAVACIRFDL